MCNHEKPKNLQHSLDGLYANKLQNYNHNYIILLIFAKSRLGRAKRRHHFNKG